MVHQEISAKIVNFTTIWFYHILQAQCFYKQLFTAPAKVDGLGRLSMFYNSVFQSDGASSNSLKQLSEQSESSSSVGVYLEAARIDEWVRT